MPKHSPDFAHLDRLIDSMYPQMERDLMALIAIPSEQAAPSGQNAPFGQAVQDALQSALDTAARFGMKTQNIDGYMGIAELKGHSDAAVGILSHVDVVPANAAQWTSPPYQARATANRIYGRGALDDKGPLIASIYAVAALMQIGAEPLGKTVRLMFGCNEESGMACLKYYLNHYAPPVCGFSPDAQFPVIIGEKGIIHFSITNIWDNQTTDSGLDTLICAKAGSAANIVPDSAWAKLAPSSSLPQSSGQVTVTMAGNDIILTAHGKAAHASTPEQGENALVILLGFLSTLDIQPTGAAAYINTLSRLFSDSCFGQSSGLASQDEVSRLTLVPSVLEITQTSGKLVCDMRFPVTHTVEQMQELISATAAANGLQVEFLEAQQPMYAGADNPTAKTLLEVYREYTGDKSEPLIIGGGTYAKAMDNFLAFGPEFADTPQVMHQADEFIRKEDLLLATKIYARAIYQLAK